MDGEEWEEAECSGNSQKPKGANGVWAVDRRAFGVASIAVSMQYLRFGKRETGEGSDVARGTRGRNRPGCVEREGEGRKLEVKRRWRGRVVRWRAGGQCLCVNLTGGRRGLHNLKFSGRYAAGLHDEPLPVELHLPRLCRTPDLDLIMVKVATEFLVFFLGTATPVFRASRIPSVAFGLGQRRGRKNVTAPEIQCLAACGQVGQHRTGEI